MLSAAERARKAATLREIDQQAAALEVAVGQLWEHVGAISLMNPQTRLHATGEIIRISQVAGVGRARTTRFVKVNPPRGGNGRYDRQSHPIDHVTLARSYRRWGDDTNPVQPRESTSILAQGDPAR